MTFEAASQKAAVLKAELHRVLAEVDEKQAVAEVLRAQIDAVEKLAKKHEPKAEAQ